MNGYCTDRFSISRSQMDLCRSFKSKGLLHFKASGGGAARVRHEIISEPEDRNSIRSVSDFLLESTTRMYLPGCGRRNRPEKWVEI